MADKDKSFWESKYFVKSGGLTVLGWITVIVILAYLLWLVFTLSPDLNLIIP